jgi:hypothetical protein
MSRRESSTRRIKLARWAESLVDLIDRHKAIMLGGSITLAVLLVIAAIMEISLGEGSSLTKSLADLGGYVAIVGLVLGFPALGYAMVTDRSVEQLSETLSITEGALVTMRKNIGQRIFELLSARGNGLPSGHYVQVFAPNRRRTRLRPVYDPTKTGPQEGWEVNPEAPQAVTGSAWVADEYFFATGDALSDPALRLTPDQLKRFDGITGVAAAPIRDDEDTLGVLTIFTEVDNPQMASPEFIRMHLALASAVAPALSDRVASEGSLDKASNNDYDTITPEEAVGRTSGSVKSPTNGVL